MDSLRDDIKNIIRNNLHLVFESHAAMTNPLMFNAKLRVLENNLDIVVDNILELISNASK